MKKKIGRPLGATKRAPEQIRAIFHVAVRSWSRTVRSGTRVEERVARLAMMKAARLYRTRLRKGEA